MFAMSRYIIFITKDVLELWTEWIMVNVWVIGGVCLIEP